MWDDKDALFEVEGFFRDDEVYLQLQKQPRFYALSLRTVPALLLYTGFGVTVFLHRGDNTPLTVLLFLISSIAVLYFLVTRCAVNNYIVISQYALYRYIGKIEKQVDEIPWRDIRKIIFKPKKGPFNCATVRICCRWRYIRQFYFLQKHYWLRNANRRLTGPSYRDLTLGKPLTLYFSVRYADEWIQTLDDLRRMQGYTYRIVDKRR